MYKGFNVRDFQFKDNDSYLYESGVNVNRSNEQEVKHCLDKFTSADGEIDGSILQDHWFPQINADVFISHSHNDLELALRFAGWMKRQFGLNAFIDSCVWGYAEHLLKQIDLAHCFNPIRATYSYNKRNMSTSHVHMMLATALGMMIDNTECLFFLNTPSSITPGSSIEKTCSPWLFAEIAMTNIVRRKTPEFHRRTVDFSESAQRQDAHSHLRIEYAVNTTSLVNIKGNSLSEWQLQWQRNTSQHPLDTLYRVTG